MYGILPEIVGKWYNRMPVAEKDGTVPIPAAVDTSDSKNDDNDDDDDDDNGRCWCYCNQPSFGDMIMCDNKQCSIHWFHFDCLRIRTPPKGKWYCPSCCKLEKFNKQKRSNFIMLFCDMIICIYSCGTTGGHMLIQAQHTRTILSTVLSPLLSLCDTKLIGRVPFRIVYFLLRV